MTEKRDDKASPPVVVKRESKAPPPLKILSGHYGVAPQPPEELPSVWQASAFPLSTNRYVFLGEAIRRVARVVTRSDWSGSVEQRAAGAYPIISACIDAALASYLRLKDGGPPQNIPPAKWFSEKDEKLIESCAMRSKRGEPGWVYVDGAGLEDLIQRLGQAASVTPSRRVQKTDLNDSCVRAAISAAGSTVGDKVAAAILRSIEGEQAAGDPSRINSVRALLGANGYNAERLRQL